MSTPKFHQVGIIYMVFDRTGLCRLSCQGIEMAKAAMKRGYRLCVVSDQRTKNFYEHRRVVLSEHRFGEIPLPADWMPLPEPPKEAGRA